MVATTFLSSFILTIILTYLIIRLSYRQKILDYPRKNSIHEKPIPMTGGIAVFFVFFTMSLILKASKDLLPFFAASIPILIGGIYDDIKGMNASQKLLIQFVSSVILISFGIVATKVKVPFGPIVDLGALSIPATILWLMLMTNLMNVIDGLDGLAAGLSAIIFLVLFLIFVDFTWAPPINTQLLILLGSTSAILIFNFHPAKIFLGNNGSTFLGFTIAYFALITSQKSTIIPILILPCIILFIHVIDVAYAITRRAKNGISIFKGDKKHIHHIMLNVIGNHRLTVLAFYLVSLILAFAILNLTR